jgi:hypothetical protein
MLSTWMQCPGSHPETAVNCDSLSMSEMEMLCGNAVRFQPGTCLLCSSKLLYGNGTSCRTVDVDSALRFLHCLCRKGCFDSTYLLHLQNQISIYKDSLILVMATLDNHWPITVAALSKAWTVFARSNTGIVGSTPTEDMDVFVVLFCV